MAIGPQPAATPAAAPPLDPPLVRPSFQGLRVVPVTAPACCNDNHPSRRLAAAAIPAGRQRLTSHWRESGGRLECHWQIEPADETSAAARKQAGQVSPDAATLFGRPRIWNTPAWFFRQGSLLVLYTGGDVGLRTALQEQLGEPFAHRAEADKRKLSGLAPPGESTTRSPAPSTAAPVRPVAPDAAFTS